MPRRRRRALLAIRLNLGHALRDTTAGGNANRRGDRSGAERQAGSKSPPCQGRRRPRYLVRGLRRSSTPVSVPPSFAIHLCFSPSSLSRFLIQLSPASPKFDLSCILIQKMRKIFKIKHQIFIFFPFVIPFLGTVSRIIGKSGVGLKEDLQILGVRIKTLLPNSARPLSTNFLN